MSTYYVYLFYRLFFYSSRRTVALKILYISENPIWQRSRRRNRLFTHRLAFVEQGKHRPCGGRKERYPCPFDSTQMSCGCGIILVQPRTFLWNHLLKRPVIWVGETSVFFFRVDNGQVEPIRRPLVYDKYELTNIDIPLFPCYNNTNRRAP